MGGSPLAPGVQDTTSPLPIGRTVTRGRPGGAEKGVSHKLKQLKDNDDVMQGRPGGAESELCYC